MELVVKAVRAVVLGIVLMGVPFVGRWVADLFDLSTVDPDGAFAWISIHHIVQAAVVLLVIVIIRRVRSVSFQLGLGERAAGTGYLKRFVPFFSLYTAGAFVSVIALGGFRPFPFPLTAQNIAGHLAFQLLLSGPSEEIIFRAFAITLFSHRVTARRVHPRVSYANLFAALIFGLAHVYITFNPLTLSYSLGQVVYATALGLFYGDCYERSSSVIYPMLMHSYTNVLMTGVTIVISLVI